MVVARAGEDGAMPRVGDEGAAARAGEAGLRVEGEGEEFPAIRCLRRLSLPLLRLSATADQDQAGLPPPLALEECAWRARRVKGVADVAAALAAYLRGRHRATQVRVFELFQARPDLQMPVELSPAANRELCFRQLHALVREAGVRPLSLKAVDPAKYFAVMEAAGGVDISLGVNLGVQYSSPSQTRKEGRPTMSTFPHRRCHRTARCPALHLPSRRYYSMCV